MFGLANRCHYKAKDVMILLWQRRPMRHQVIQYSTCNSSDPSGNIKRLNSSCTSNSGRSSIQICYKPYVKPPPMDHDYKNMALKRPMSPHLTVLAMTLPATLSILQRITGVIITSYALMLTGGALFLPNGIETYVSMIQSLDLNSTVVTIIKVVVGLPFVYHFFNGIRFCLWNAGYFLTLKGSNFTAALAMIGIVVGVAVFAYI